MKFKLPCWARNAAEEFVVMISVMRVWLVCKDKKVINVKYKKIHSHHNGHVDELRLLEEFSGRCLRGRRRCGDDDV
jgi:hypothetical protein